MTLASNIIPSSASSSLVVTATKKPVKKPVKTPKKPAFKTIKKQIHFFSALAPGPVDQTPCENITDPIVLSGLIDLVQLDSMELVTCGWNTNKDVIATITKSDGTILTKTLPIYPYSPWGLILFDYSPTAFDPTGNYKIQFSNGGQVLDVGFIVNPITEPGAVIIPGNKEVQVYNFQPNEKIRVFQYSLLISSTEGIWGPAEVLEWKLEAWQDRQLGSEGRLRIPIKDTRGHYVVIGEQTGEYNTDRGDIRIGTIRSTDTPVAPITSACPKALPSRVQVGSPARVTTSSRLRTEPSRSGDIIISLPKSTLVLILDGPECSNGYIWWYGVTTNGVEGWIAESEKAVYLLETVP